MFHNYGVVFNVCWMCVRGGCIGFGRYCPPSLTHSPSSSKRCCRCILIALPARLNTHMESPTLATVNIDFRPSYTTIRPVDPEISRVRREMVRGSQMTLVKMIRSRWIKAGVKSRKFRIRRVTNLHIRINNHTRSHPPFCTHHSRLRREFYLITLDA